MSEVGEIGSEGAAAMAKRRDRTKEGVERPWCAGSFCAPRLGRLWGSRAQFFGSCRVIQDQASTEMSTINICVIMVYRQARESEGMERKSSGLTRRKQR